MTPSEAAALLTVAAAFDNRKPDPDTAQAWALALDGIRFEDARAAVVAHYRDSSDWLMPSRVRATVRKIREHRVTTFGTLPDPPPGLDPDDTAAYTAYLTQTRRAIADGHPERIPDPTAIARIPGLAFDWSALMPTVPTS